MTEKEAIVINDDLFQNTVSCPLKLTHITNKHLKRISSKLYFRQRNKLHIRDAIATRFENCRHTSNTVEQAARETETWLKEDTVAICGAVIQQENLLTRIPILVRDGGNLTIIQVHGKLRKRSDGDEIRPGIKKRSIVQYLLKAAFRLEVLKRCFPKYEIDIHFYFPGKHFNASADNLHLFDQQLDSDFKEIKRELTKLFAKVYATKAVEQVLRKIPGELSHKQFANRSVSDAIQTINRLIEQSPNQPDVDRHSGCKYCEFRLSTEENAGCWSQFFPAENMSHPEKHIFELIGQGNSTESENGTYYQEEAEISRSFQSLEDLTDHPGPTITILNRRNLQILRARDLKIPSLWLKQNVKFLDELTYPLHFLDFEAATYALPMKQESRPYSPVYFQFSCHTLYEDGKLVQSEWLDLQEGTTHPHKKFVQQMEKIPGIFEGTIMQYSPFEKQGVNRLIADFKRDHDRYRDEMHILEKIKEPELSGYKNRFFDVSRLIRDFYFNEFLDDSLGLKKVLKSILKWEKHTFSHSHDFFDDQMRQFFLEIDIHISNQTIVDPYKYLQDSDIAISDGSDAMNAWLAFKIGLLSEDEKEIIPGMLKKYCALDSLALYVIFKHINRFTDKFDDNNYILFQQK